MTKDKWVVEENGDMYITSMVNGYKRYICRIGTKNSTTNGENLANAEHIVQVVNSFDDLMEASKFILEYFSTGALDSDLRVRRENLKQAIAQAEMK